MLFQSRMEEEMSSAIAFSPLNNIVSETNYALFGIDMSLDLMKPAGLGMQLCANLSIRHLIFAYELVTDFP